MLEYTVSMTWDDEAAVWLAESQEIPGLILESGSFDALVERVKTAVPDLLELDKQTRPNVSLHFMAERQAIVA